MDTEHLKLFVLAAKTLNISAAGRTLGLAPAVASARLAKLETTLGVELLHRSTRKVSLSLAGEEFLPYAKEILAQEDTALDILGRREARASGRLRFAATSTFAQRYIVPLLATFFEQHPDIDLELRLSDTPFDLIDGSFDLALRNVALADSSLRARKLADDQRVLCASPAYLARHGTPAHPAELDQHQLIAFRDAGPKTLRGPAGATGRFDPAAANSRLSIDDGLSLKLATLAGVGISANSLWSVHEALADGRLVSVLPEFSLVDNAALWLVYPKSNVLTAKVRVFIDFLVQHIGDAPPWLSPRSSPTP